MDVGGAWERCLVCPVPPVSTCWKAASKLLRWLSSYCGRYLVCYGEAEEVDAALEPAG